MHLLNIAGNQTRVVTDNCACYPASHGFQRLFIVCEGRGVGRGAGRGGAGKGYKKDIAGNIYRIITL